MPVVQFVAAGQVWTAPVPTFASVAGVYGDSYTVTLTLSYNSSRFMPSVTTLVQFPFVSFSYSNMWIDSMSPSSMTSNGGKVRAPTVT